MAALKWLVGIMGVLIVVGTVALAMVIVQRLGAAADGYGLAIEHLGQPEGTRILAIAAADGRLTVLVARPDGERLLVLDARRGRLLGELRATE